jgi:hypothetical protein
MERGRGVTTMVFEKIALLGFSSEHEWGNIPDDFVLDP